MGFLVGIISFFISMFTFVQLLGMVFVAVPYLNNQKVDKAIIKVRDNMRKGIILHTIITIVVIIISFTALKAYLTWILICYIAIPTIIAFGMNNQFLFDLENQIEMYRNDPNLLDS